MKKIIYILFMILMFATTYASCGFLTQDYTLQEDLIVVGNCFIVGENDITIDGNGFSITGDGTGTGIEINGFDRITVKNFEGIIDFNNGVYASDSLDNTINNNNIVQSGVGGYGIRIFSSNTQIMDNTITINGEKSSGIHIYGKNNIVKDNDVQIDESYFGFARYGIFVLGYDNNKIEGNTIKSSSDWVNGILIKQSQGNTIKDNVVELKGNSQNKVLMFADGSNNIITGNKLSSTNHFEVYMSSVSNSGPGVEVTGGNVFTDVEIDGEVIFSSENIYHISFRNEDISNFPDNADLISVSGALYLSSFTNIPGYIDLSLGYEEGVNEDSILLYYISYDSNGYDNSEWIKIDSSSVDTNSKKVNSGLINFPFNGNNYIFVAAFAQEDTCDDIDSDDYLDVACGGNDCDDSDSSINPDAIEVCDALDNNCNGNIDESLYLNCGSDVGECVKGTKTCLNGEWSSCSDSIEPATEVCDNLDNDCDGTVDEGCSCLNGQEQACGETDVGECNFGIQTCTNDVWSDCFGNVGPVEEICGDELDNDCDGLVDEGCECEGDDCEEEIVATCVDTDNGKNYYVKGNSIASSSGILWWDRCREDNGKLVETFCNGNNLNFDEFECEFGCLNGVCLTTEGNECEDTDGGLISFIYGGVKKGDEELGDCCYGSQVIETYCDSNGSISKSLIDCSFGCQDGACIIDVEGCNDTDLGYNIFEKGTVDELDGQSWTDHCRSDNGNLVENACRTTGDLVAFREFICPNGCLDGICQGYEEFTCAQWETEDEELPILGGCKPEKLLICHGLNNPHELCIAQSALDAHLDHGDYNGYCQTDIINIGNSDDGSEDSNFVIGDKTDCDGCRINDTCYTFGTRLFYNKAQQFCRINKEFSLQKDEGSSCKNDYECLINSCNDSKCVDLEKEIKDIDEGDKETKKANETKEKKGLLQRVMAWF